MVVGPLTKLYLVMEEFRKFDPEMPIQFAEVLLLVAREPGINGTELRARAGISKSALSRILDRLSDREDKGLGLIQLREDPNDLRYKLASLTLMGRRVIRSIEFHLAPEKFNT